jgi:hypothetical protein
MILPFEYIGYKRLSENKRFPNHVGTATPPGGKMGEWSPLTPGQISNDGYSKKHCGH